VLLWFVLWLTRACAFTELQKQLLGVLHSARQEDDATSASTTPAASGQEIASRPVQLSTASVATNTSDLDWEPCKSDKKVIDSLGSCLDGGGSLESTGDDCNAGSGEDRSPSLLSSSGSTDASDEQAEGWRVFPDDPTQLYIYATESCPPEDEVDEEGCGVELENAEAPPSPFGVSTDQRLDSNSLSPAPTPVSGPNASPVDLVDNYLLVHSSILRIQKVARGFLVRSSYFRGKHEHALWLGLTSFGDSWQVRRGFWRLLEKLMLQDEEVEST